MSGMKMTSLKNRLNESTNSNLEFNFRKVTLNGVVLGTSGHVRNKDNGVVVYVNTEPSVYGPLSDKVMFRLARDFKDFSSNGSVEFRNRWGLVRNNEFVSDMVKLLETGK